jgi:hypothetical protein
MFLGGLVAVYVLATAAVVNTNFTDGSGWFAMWSILMLTTLCATGIIDTVSGFGGSSYRLDSCSVPGMQVTLLVMAFGVRFIAFCLVVMTNEVLHLDLGWLTELSDSVRQFRLYFKLICLQSWFLRIYELLVRMCHFGLCRNKFDYNFRVAVG